MTKLQVYVGPQSDPFGVAITDWITPWATVQFDPKTGTTKKIPLWDVERHAAVSQPVLIRLKKKYRSV